MVSRVAWQVIGRGAACIAAFAAALSGCTNTPAAPAWQAGALRGANVLLITIDTLRQDRVGAYGRSRGLTPAIDRLADSGIRYTHAFSHAPMTLPAHASVLTGLTPPHHGVRTNVTFRLDERVPTLATVLKGAGYRSGAFVGAFVLDARFGLNHGFDVYDDHYAHQGDAPTFKFVRRSATDVVKAAGDWIVQPRVVPDRPAAASRQPPWLAWVHLFDPHAPYEAPPEYRAGRAPYDAAVAYTDATVGAFLDRLRAEGALDRTLVILTSDHGESLGEHGETTHGLFVYDATLAVPLIFCGPSIRPGVIESAAAHIDIMPTVLDLLGVTGPATLDGRSLVGKADVDRPLYFEALDANLARNWAPLTGLVRGGWKYIELPIPELYDLRTDSAERTNRAESDRPMRDAMARALASLTSRSAAVSATPAIDAAAADRLRALGYVGGRTAAAARRYTEADDPKRLVALSERFNTALEAFNEDRRDEALDAFMALLRERPDFETARTSAATVLLSEGRTDAAVALLEAAPPEQRGSPQLLARLGSALRQRGDLQKAAAAFERARQAGDQNPDLFNDLGVVYARLGREAQARAMFDELLRRDPDAAGTWYNLGILELEHRHTEAAAVALRRAVEADPSYSEAWQALGAATLDRDRASAIDAWKHAERFRPRDYDLLFNLAMVLADSGRGSEALPYLQRFVREAPRDRYASDIRRVEAAIARVRRGTR
jgi:arylsulfatase A-like enzyme/Flp pilus assembly protein TadD